MTFTVTVIRNPSSSIIQDSVPTGTVTFTAENAEIAEGTQLSLRGDPSFLLRAGSGNEAISGQGGEKPGAAAPEIAASASGGLAMTSSVLSAVEIVSGQAIFITADLPAGVHTINATYSGDADFASSAATIDHLVNTASTITTVASSANPSTFGEPVTFTATISGGVASTGTVDFKDGETIIASGVVLNGNTATYSTTALSAGSHSVTAVYSGDANNSGSTSEPIIQTVNPAEPEESVSLIVRLAAGISPEEQQQVIARNGGTQTSSVPVLRMHFITIPETSAAAIMQQYQSDPQVLSIEHDKVRKVRGTPSDPIYPDQWALPKIGWDSVFGSATPTGTSVLAILDTGIDATHPDLSGLVLPGYSAFEGSDAQTDPNGHGTQMAGIAAALTDNATGISGVAYSGVSLLPVQVLGADGTGQDSDIINGIVWAAENGANVILMAFSNPDYSEALQAAIDYAWDSGVVLVAAVGNDSSSTVTYPAGDRGVIGVSATDSSDALAAFSNYGPSVFLAAPGTDISATNTGNAYTGVTGTSASAAMVAGAAAFMKAADPSLTNGVIVNRLALSADLVGTQEQTGNGRLNMASALNETSTDFIQPAGAAPLGEGGPYVGRYHVAATKTSTASGNWNAAIWSPAGTPVAGDDVIIASGHTVTLNVAGACNNLSISNSAAFNVGGFNLTVNGATSITGTLTHTSTAGAKTFIGLVTINSGGVWNNAINELLAFRGGITFNGSTFTSGTAVYTFATNSQAISGSAFTIDRVTVTGVTLTNNITSGGFTVTTALIGTGGLTQAANAILNITGTSTITTLTANAAGNTVNYTGAAQTVKTTTYNNLTTSGSGTKTTAGIVAISGNLDVGSGTTFATGATNTWTLSVTGTTSVTGTLTLANTGTKTFTGDVTINSGGTLNFTAIATVSFSNNLIISGGIITGTATGILNVAGTLTVPVSTTADIRRVTITIGSTSSISGTLSFTTAATGTKTFVGLVTIESGGSWNNAINSPITFRGGITFNGSTFTSGTGIYTFNTNAQAISGSAFTINSVTVTGVTLTNNIASGGFTVATALIGTGGLTNSATGILNLSGTCSITTLANAGIINRSGTGTTTTALANFTNTGTINLNGSGAITGITNNADGIINLASSGTITSLNNATATSTLNISATPVPTITLTATATGNTVNYTGTGQTLKVTAYHHLTLSGGAETFGAITTINGDLTLSGTATATTAAALAVSGNLAIGDGTTLTTGAFTLSVTGTTTVGDGVSGTLAFSSATNPNKTFTGLVTINAGASWTENAAITPTFRGGITSSGTFTAGSGVHTFDTNSQALTGTFSIPRVTVTGVTLTNNGTLTVATALAGTGGLTNASTGTLNLNFTGSVGITTLTATAVGNTVNYGFAGTQTVKAVSYYHLTLSNSGAKTMTGVTAIGGDLTVSGSATMTGNAGFTVTDAFNYGSSGSTTLTASAPISIGAFNQTAGTLADNGNTITVTGTGASTWVKSGTFTATGTATFTGAAPQIGASNFNNLTISVGSTATLAGTITVGANLNISSGTLDIGANGITVTGTTSVTGTLTHSSATGTKIYTGLVTINSGGIWNNSGNSDINFRGGLTNNGGTFTCGTGSQTFTTNAQALNGTLSIPSASTAIVLTNNGTLTISTTLAGAGTLTNSATGTLNFGGTSITPTLTATAVGNTVNYTGTGQTLKVTAYHHLTLSGGAETFGAITTVAGNLTLSGTATATTAAALAVSGNLAIGDGTTLTTGAFTLSVTGTTTVGDGASGTLAFSSATNPNKTFTGLVTINAGANWTESAAITPTFRGGITNSGTFTAGSGVHTFDTNSQALTGTFSIPSVTVTGVTLTNNDTLTVATALAGTGGTLTNAGTGTLNLNFTGSVGITTLTATASGNTVNYGFAGTQTVKAVSYYHLTLSNSGAKTMTGVTTIGGDLTISDSATMTGNAAFTVTGAFNYGSSGSTTLTASTPISIGTFNQTAGTLADNGNTITVTGTGASAWVKSGTFTATGTVTFTGAAPQMSASNFNNLIVGGTASAITAGILTIGGNLTIGDGTTFTAAGYALTVTGTTTVGAGTSGTLTISSATGAKAFNGDVTVNSGATWNNTADNASLTLPGNLLINGAFNAGTGVHTLSGTAKTI
ncbi:MAG: S8 family serine peptidase, partial [Syntrophales bacterium]